MTIDRDVLADLIDDKVREHLARSNVLNDKGIPVAAMSELAIAVALREMGEIILQATRL